MTNEINDLLMISSPPFKEFTFNLHNKFTLPMYNCLIANATRRSVNVNKNFILKYLNFASETKSEILVTVNGVTYIGKPLDPSTLNEVIRFKSTNFSKKLKIRMTISF